MRRPERLSAAELRARREASGVLLEIAAPILDRLAAAAADTGSALMLSDPSGLVLDERLHRSSCEDFTELGLTAGASWSEADEGTNGIGTTLSERRPVVIWRDQHFHARDSILTCMGAPIEAPDGGVAGVLDISSCRADLTEAQARLIAMTVQEAAIRLSCELFRRAYSSGRVVAVAPDGLLGPCLIAVDGNDLIVAANRAARRTLGLTSEEIDRNPPAVDVLHADEPFDDIDGAVRAGIMRALKRANGNVSQAARNLQLGRSTLYRKIQELGIRLDG